MTSKEKFQATVVEMADSINAFPAKMYYKPLDAKVDFLERSLLAVDMFGSKIQKWVPVIEFLIWVKNNLFNEKGKFSFPITKWLGAVSAIRKMIKKMTGE
jgi:hypothetical protein